MKAFGAAAVVSPQRLPAAATAAAAGQNLQQPSPRRQRLRRSGCVRRYSVKMILVLAIAAVILVLANLQIKILLSMGGPNNDGTSSSSNTNNVAAQMASSFHSFVDYHASNSKSNSQAAVQKRRGDSMAKSSTTYFDKNNTATSLGQIKKQKKNNNNNNVAATIDKRSGDSLHFIPYEELRELDYFSDSWLLNRQRFLEIEIRNIGIVEDAVFVAVSRNRRPMEHCRMLVDWLEFGVEHLSKWWTDLHMWVTRTKYKHSLLPTVLSKIDYYLQNNVKHPPLLSISGQGETTTTTTTTTAFQQAIAMIAFYAYRPRPRRAEKMWDPDHSRRNALNARTLAATIASLYQAGFGRVLVVGIHQKEDALHFQNACNLLLQLPSMKLIFNNFTTIRTTIYIGPSKMELEHVHVTNEEWIKTNLSKFNIPRAAIAGMQAAIRQELSDHEQLRWLGPNHPRNSSHWKYFYLTEPDTLLHTQPHILPLLKEALDKGLSLFPHRLHIIPHEADLPPRMGNATIGDTEYILNAGEFLPNVGNFANITDLNPFAAAGRDDGSTYISCCDDGRFWPGVDGNWRRCKPWWTCGRKRVAYENGEVYNATAIADNNSRLKPYPMMRLQSGTGAVFASSNHGRRCWPSTNGCRHRYSDSSTSEMRS